MPRYEIKQFWRCVRTFRVSALTPGQAIVTLCGGGPDVREIPNGREMVTADVNVGLPLSSLDDATVEEVSNLDCADNEMGFVPTICSIEEID